MTGEWRRAREVDLPAGLAVVQEMWSCRPAVAAALWFKQYAWYVVDAALSARRRGEVPDMAADAVEVRFARERPYVSVRPGPLVERVDPAPDPLDREAAYWLGVEVVKGHLAPVVDALHDLTRVGRRTLWGSVAHAIASPLAGSLEPGEVMAFMAAVGPPVDGLVDATANGVDRRTCCLAFRSEDPDVAKLCRYCPIVCAGRD